MLPPPIRSLRNRWPVAIPLCAAVLGPAVAGQVPDAQPPAAQSPGEPVAVEAFRPPKPRSYPRTDYSEDEVRALGEGWVTLSMMVDPQGKPFKVGVLDSTGNPRFEKLAVKAMEHASFEPATLAGRPIESVFEVRYVFDLGRQDAAQRGFIETIKSLQHACMANDRAAAEEALSKLEVTNLYEDAFHGLARDLYASRWGGGGRAGAGGLTGPRRHAVSSLR